MLVLLLKTCGIVGVEIDSASWQDGVLRHQIYDVILRVCRQVEVSHKCE